jgi:HSP20 family molecular chaperone IbpA
LCFFSPEAELPGVDKADLSVTLANGMLTIKAGLSAIEGGPAVVHTGRIKPI